MSSTARTILFGIFVLAGRPLTARQTVALAGPLGITATNAKSLLTRMVGEGVLLREGPVRSATYRPSSHWLEIAHAIAFRLELDRNVPWDGKWLVLTMKVPKERKARQAAAAGLWFDGFRILGAGCWIRPDWPRDWARQRANEHVKARGTVFASEAVVNENAAVACYDLDGLDRDASELAGEIASHRIWTSPEAAFAARIEVGGAVAQFIGHDPMLPAETWAGRDGMARLLTAYRAFEAETKQTSERFISASLETGRH